MEFISAHFALAVMLIILISLAVFCYDLGCSANVIRPGTGDTMIGISAASGLLTVLTGVNLTMIHKGKRKKSKQKK